LHRLNDSVADAGLFQLNDALGIATEAASARLQGADDDVVADAVLSHGNDVARRQGACIRRGLGLRILGVSDGGVSFFPGIGRIADEASGDGASRGADQRTSGRMPRSRADDGPGCGPEARSDKRPRLCMPELPAPTQAAQPDAHRD
jgi:hypothetical protein